MIIVHPLLGPRDAQEFTYLGDATLLNRPDPDADDALSAFTAYVYDRDNPDGAHQELWFHEHGDRSLIIVTRDMTTHAILDSVLAQDAVTARGNSASTPKPSDADAT